MPDRRQTECTTAEEIAQAKIDATKVGDDPSRDAVLRAVRANLQERFGKAASLSDKEPPTEPYVAIPRIGGDKIDESESLDEAGVKKVRALFESPDAGYEGYALQLLRSEQVEIDEGLRSLVVEPINALSEAQRTVKGRVRSGEEIARAIPDVAAFLDAVSLRKDGKFFELNEEGQLVIEDGCPEAYGLGDDFPKAKMRQACIWYLDDQGVTQSLQGEGLYTVKEVYGKEFGVEGKVQVLELTEAAKKVVPTMVSGLPTLKWDGERHTGEYARMNTGQLERSKITWTDDDSLDGSRARAAFWRDFFGYVLSIVDVSIRQDDNLGSRGVLRVNLNFEL